MKILMISGVFPPRKYGGITAISYLIAKKLRERGNEVTVFTTDVGNDAYSRLNVQGVDIMDGVHVHYFRNISNMLAFKHRILLPVGMIPSLIKYINCYDIVHLNGLRNIHNVAAAHCAKKYGVPYLQQSHGDIPRIMEKKRLKRLYDMLLGYALLRNASRVIALNKFEAEQYRNMGISNSKIAIIPNGIDLSEFVNLPPKGLFKERFGIPENKKLILYLSRINKIKGTDFLVRAYAYLVKKMHYEDAVLVIAGPDEGFLKDVKLLTHSLGVSNSVLFTGPLYGKEKNSAYVDSDVYVLPSRYETFPMGLLEAYACGKPVIVSKVGGVKDLVIEGETGFFVEPGNIKQLATRLFFLLSNDNEARKMGIKGKMFVKNFAIDKVVARLEELYREVVFEKS